MSIQDVSRSSDNDDEEYKVTTITSKRNYDVLYKVLVIGESSVGKTALINKYQNPDKPLPNLLSTIGIDYRSVDIIIDGLRVRVQLWDTVGQERYRTMTKNFFRGAKGVLLLFDVTNRDTFIRVENWINSLKQNDLDREEIFLIGNKIDLKSRREIEYDEGRLLAASFGMKYFETSAMTGENVIATIEQLVYNIKDMHNLFQSSTRRASSLCENKWDALINGGAEDASTTIRLKPLTRKQKVASRCCQRSRNASVADTL